MSVVWSGIGIYLLTGLALLGGMYVYVRLRKGWEPGDSDMAWMEMTAAWLALLLLWPLAFGMLVQESLFKRPPQPTRAYRRWVATPESLTECMTLEAIEQREIYRDPLNAVPPVPFGHLHDAWQRFRQRVQDEDQLWAFSIDTDGDQGLDYLKRRGLVEGYALFREGEICDEFFARME